MKKVLYALMAAIVATVGLTAWEQGRDEQSMVSNTPRQGGARAAEPAPATDINARMASITGKPLRIAPLKASELGKDAAGKMEGLRQAVSGPATPANEVPEYTAIMLRHPDLFQRHTDLAVQLFHSALSAHDRELAILRIAWLSQAPFEWGEHVKLGKRLGGLTSEEIERVTQGSAAPGWNDHDRALLRAVEELHGNAMISDDTWAVLAKGLDEKQLIELPILIGQYQGVAYLQNSLRLHLLPGNPGLSSR